jgi:hypothetical protein
MRCEIREIGKNFYAMSIIDPSDKIVFIRSNKSIDTLYNKAAEEYGFDKDEVTMHPLQVRGDEVAELKIRSQEHRQFIST